VALTPGTRLGPYEVVAPLGEGGMGEVYRATDTTLKRDVAIKVLPDALAHDAERLARFEREAQILASLNHPHIAHIHGLEQDGGAKALVLELVEGPTLADRIAQGAIPIDEALAIAKQIAEAVEAAHEQGIIHRDLKPANIKVRPDGTVKVLDFGLAAVALGAGPAAVDSAHSPSITMAATHTGVILGTVAYMPPEQAAGKPVDKRADVWSFGVVLWEMLSGRRLFEGETVSHTLADVLRKEIDFGTLPLEIPAAIHVLLRRCLDRDVKARLRDIGEARIAIQRYLADPLGARESSAVAAAPVDRPMLTIAALGVAAIAVTVAAGLAFVHFRERPAVAAAVRFQMMPPEQTTFQSIGVLSPDGRRIAFEAPGPSGRPVLWVRSLDALEARPLAGTEGAIAGPIWSPDSRFLAFGVNGYPGRLKKVAESGGPPQTLCEYTGGFREGAWNADGVILFGATGAGLLRVSDSGGPASPVTIIDPSRKEVQHAGPTFLPDGRSFLYHRASSLPDNTGVYIGSLDLAPEGQSTTRLLATDSDPVYVPASGSDGGFLLFLRQGTLMAQPFDGRSQLRGDTIPIAEQVGNLGSYGWFSASGSGALAFRTGLVTGSNVDLVWVDRQGKRLGQLGPRLEAGFGVQLSPDGKRVVVDKWNLAALSGVLGNYQGARLWTAEVSRAIFSRLNTAAEGMESSPAISPDGRVAFLSDLGALGAIRDLYWMRADGTGVPEPLLVKSPTVKHPNSFSPDGRFLIYDDHTAQRQDLWILPIEPSSGGERKPIPFLVTPADETFGQFSPDGKWIAYSSDESGRREVYVQGFVPDRVPAAGVGKWQMSTAGGDKPRWRRDGTELYYLAPDRKMMAVPVKLGPPFEPGVAVPLFEARTVGFFPYDVSPDGRLLLNTPAESEATSSSPITIVLNWQAGLRQ
jgi:Tol biopolymer transport system component